MQPAQRLAISVDDDRRLDELVGPVGLVARLDRGRGAGGVATGAIDIGGKCPVGALPALVAVHAVVAPDDGRDPADLLASQLGFELLEVAGPAAGRRISPVHDRVHQHLVGRQPLGARQLQQGVEMGEVAMDPAVRGESHQVEPRPVSSRLAHRLEQHRVVEEAAVSDRHRDAHQVLIGNAASTQVLMADLAVAHLAGRQADRFARRLEQAVRVLGQQPIEHRQPCQRDRVAVATRRARVLVGNSPSVPDDQQHRPRPAIGKAHSVSVPVDRSNRIPATSTASAQRKPAA